MSNTCNTDDTGNWGIDADDGLELRSRQSEQHLQDDEYAMWTDKDNLQNEQQEDWTDKDNLQNEQQEDWTDKDNLQNEQQEDWTDYRRTLHKVNVDPRTVGFIYGKRRQNVRAISADIRDSTGFTIFMEYVNVDNGSYGYWKCLSKSMPAIALAETWLKEKEWECVEAINSGSYKPWKYPAYNQQDNRTDYTQDDWGLNGWDYDTDNNQYYGW